MGSRRGKEVKASEDSNLQASKVSKSEPQIRRSTRSNKYELPALQSTNPEKVDNSPQPKQVSSRLSRKFLPRATVTHSSNKEEKYSERNSLKSSKTAGIKKIPCKTAKSDKPSASIDARMTEDKSRSKCSTPKQPIGKNSTITSSVKKIKGKRENIKKEKTELVSPSPVINVSNLDISSILALGENMKQDDETKNLNSSKDLESDDSDFENSSESENDWEEVSPEDQSELDNLEKKLSDNSYTIPKEGVQITIAKDEIPRKKGKRGFDIQGYIRREVNRNTKELYVDLHKVSLLCLIARGRMINNYLTIESNLAVGFSVLPSRQSCPPKHADIGYLERFIKWFCNAIKVNPYILDSYTKETADETKSSFENELVYQLQKKEVVDRDNLAFMFILILRSCGMKVRLVWSLQPIPLKPSSDKLLRKPKEVSEDDSDNETKVAGTSKNKKVAKDDSNYKDELPGTSKSKNVNGSKKTVPVKTKSSTMTTKGKPKNEKGKKLNDNNESKGRKMISSSEEEDGAMTRKGIDKWPEVYLEEEERWVSVDLMDEKFMCDTGVETKATKKISYIIALDNNNNIKDVTRRYDSHWLVGTQKLRVSDWWDDTLLFFRGKKTILDKMEDSFLDQVLISQPFPKSIQEFKGHPLYALRRHLLKFEAIYPSVPPQLGSIKNEAVYPRECVRTLHSREIWLKQAKVVRIGEVAYKVVKSRPKYDKVSGQLLASHPLDLFGEWQVEDFVPPTAENGVVPRNEYGNVELFLEKMLPKGTVHLKLPALNRTAKKLGIDCALALTGFDFHCGGSHPTYDGYVVCEEFKDVLIDAWNEEHEEQQKREKEKRLKRIYDNWAKLLKGLLIREKLNKKYNFNLGGKRKNEETSDDAKDKEEAGPSTKRWKK